MTDPRAKFVSQPFGWQKPIRPPYPPIDPPKQQKLGTSTTSQHYGAYGSGNGSVDRATAYTKSQAASHQWARQSSPSTYGKSSTSGTSWSCSNASAYGKLPTYSISSIYSRSSNYGCTSTYGGTSTHSGSSSYTTTR